jgi:hypothetical protein
MTRLMARVAFTGDFGDPEHTNAERDCTLDVDAAAESAARSSETTCRLLTCSNQPQL